MHKLIPLAIIISLVSAAPVLANTLKISIETTSDTGNIRAAVYPSEEAFKNGIVSIGTVSPAKLGTTKLEIKGLAPGTYGIVLFQDLNGNEELDRNLLGIPNEPFGFSNNPTIRFSAPKFEEFKFEYDGTETELNIKLNGG